MEYLAAYLDHLAHERGLSALTCENYGRDIRGLIDMAGTTPLRQLQPAHIRRFIASLHGRGIGGKSIARMLSSWRGFFTFLAHRHGFDSNPCVGMRAPKTARALPQALSVEQAVRLVEVTDTDPLAVRDHAILELFYSSGLRLAELVTLTLAELDFAGGVVTVTGKGSKTRIVPLGCQAAAAIRDWLVVRALLVKEDERAVFVGKNGRQLTPRAVQYRLKQWAIRQGIAGNVHPHVLRHSFATHVLQSSGDLRAVQEMLGHANISTTQVYTHLDFQHLSKVYDQTHPRARKKK